MQKSSFGVVLGLISWPAWGGGVSYQDAKILDSIRSKEFQVALKALNQTQNQATEGYSRLDEDFKEAPSGSEIDQDSVSKKITDEFFSESNLHKPLRIHYTMGLSANGQFHMNFLVRAKELESKLNSLLAQRYDTQWAQHLNESGEYEPKPYLCHFKKDGVPLSLDHTLLYSKSEQFKFLFSCEFKIDGKPIVIELSNTRDHFKRSLKDADVVIYHGHSRYGRGPAFGKMSNYFRMGKKSAWPLVEIDYADGDHRDERDWYADVSTVRGSQYKANFVFPDQTTVTFDGGRVRIGDADPIELPYKGPRLSLDADPSLGEDTDVVPVPGGATDLNRLVNGDFNRDRSRILFLYSCKSQARFTEPLREVFKDRNKTQIYGTRQFGRWLQDPIAYQIFGVLMRAPASTILSKMNSTPGVCDDDLDPNNEYMGKNCFVNF